jgi:SAM-dependent methyltransferase
VTGEIPISRFRCLHCGGEAWSGKSSESSLQCPGCHASFRVEDGIVVLSDVTDDHDYPEAVVDLVAKVEHRHFWFAARNQVILTAMRRALGPLRGKRVLDVGCGTGFVAAALENAGMDVWGVDMHLGSLKRARQRVRGPLFASQSRVHPFFPDFACATLLDVIEHLEDDVSAVRQAAAVLQADGFVVVTVPAGLHLWTRYDEVIGHKRRYGRQTLTDVLHRAGLDVRYMAYFSCLPLLAQVMQRRMTTELKRASSATIDIVEAALRVPPEPLNSLFRLSVSAEAPLRRFQWLRGGSLIAVARRRL